MVILIALIALARKFVILDSEVSSDKIAALPEQPWPLGLFIGTCVKAAKKADHQNSINSRIRPIPMDIDSYRRPPDPFYRHLMAVVIILVALILLWKLFPAIEYLWPPSEDHLRTVTARGDLATDEKSTIELFEKSRGSVVFISTAALVRDIWTRNVFAVPKGTGSGFIWDDAGHVITNYHVIEKASGATVKLADGRDYKAILVGASPAHDIAVLRIVVGFNRPRSVPIGTSHDLKVGQKVFAIGNPFGLDWSLTSGIVSALDRSLPSNVGPAIEHLIQTDAAINPGNSGGPLLDSAGRLIGINTAIYSPSGASAGIGFAVPVDTVMRVVPILIKNGKYLRPSLGIEADEQINKRVNAATGSKGVVVLRVQSGSAAEKAGLKGATVTSQGMSLGDIIIAVDSKEVDSVKKLLALLDDYKVGDAIQLTIMRHGEKRDLSVTLEPGN